MKQNYFTCIKVSYPRGFESTCSENGRYGVWLEVISEDEWKNQLSILLIKFSISKEILSTPLLYKIQNSHKTCPPKWLVYFFSKCDIQRAYVVCGIRNYNALCSMLRYTWWCKIRIKIHRHFFHNGRKLAQVEAIWRPLITVRHSNILKLLDQIHI